MIIVFCKTTKRGEQSFYIADDHRQYFLFAQEFRRSNKEYFGRGVILDNIYDFSHTRSTSTIRTLEKIQKYIPYIEREEGIVLRRQTRRKQARSQKSFRQRKQELYCFIAEY